MTPSAVFECGGEELIGDHVVLYSPIYQPNMESSPKVQGPSSGLKEVLIRWKSKEQYHFQDQPRDGR